MTQVETNDLIKRLAVYYPALFAKMDREKAVLMVREWTRALGPYSAEEVNGALDKLLTTSVFCPSIAELLEAVQAVRHDKEMTRMAYEAAVKTYGGDPGELVKNMINAPSRITGKGGYKNHFDGEGGTQA